METEINVENTARQGGVEKELSDATSAGPIPPAAQSLLAKRVAEHFLNGLNQPDPDDALLAVTTGHLFSIAASIGSMLKSELAVGPLTLGMVEKLTPTTDSYLRLLRQFDRLTSTKARIEKDRAKANEMKMQKQAHALDALLM